MNPDLQLRDIHLPAEIGWWPPAIGWWLVALLLLLGLFYLFRHWRSNRPQPVPAVCGPALAELKRLEQAYADNPGQLIREVSVLLRRSAMSLYGRQRVSGLSGEAWLQFLDQQSRAPEQQVFHARFHRVLTELPYREHSGDGSVAELVQTVRDWLQDQQNGHDTFASGSANNRKRRKSRASAPGFLSGAEGQNEYTKGSSDHV